MRTLILALLLWGTLLPALRAGDKVVLLHGLVRTPASMKRLEKALTKAGYEVVNWGIAPGSSLWKLFQNR